MNLQSLKLKASTLCAGGTLLVFGGFLTVNLAGCGGGKGGLTTVPTPTPVGATFRIVQQDSTPSRGGSVTLTGNGQTFTGTADSNGVVVLPNVPPGTYSVTFTSNGSAGALPSTTRSITITRSGAQNFVLVQGDTGNGAFTLTGVILQNPGNAANVNCDATSVPFTGSVLISVRDLNDVTGSPIIAQLVRPVQDPNAAFGVRGRYTISIPTRPRTFRVEVSPADNNGLRIAGLSATTTFTEGNTNLTNVDICANTNGTIPGPVVTPTPTATPDTTGGTLGGFPVVTPTPTATIDPNALPTATPTATTVAPTPTPTVQGGTNLGSLSGATLSGSTLGTGGGTVNPTPIPTVATFNPTPLPTTPVGTNATGAFTTNRKRR